MTDPHLARMLDLVRRELEAADARIEIGGREPADDCIVWCPLPGGARLVAIFDAPPGDRGSVRERLGVLARSFESTGESAMDISVLSGELASRRLDDELAALADRAGAVRAVVIDAQSPVIWGTSEMRRSGEDVESAFGAADALAAAERSGIDLARLLEQGEEDPRAVLEARGVEPPVLSFLVRSIERIRQHSRRSGSAWHHHLLTARAIAAVRRNNADDEPVKVMVHERGFGYLARSFANIYRLLLVFDGEFSELAAEGAVVHALPVIERLVLGLPPVEPPPKGGRVIRLPPR